MSHEVLTPDNSVKPAAPSQPPVSPKLPDITEAERIKLIIQKVNEEVKDDDAFLDIWKDTVGTTKIIYQNKLHNMPDLLKYIINKLKIPADPNVLDVRRMEVEVGNLLHEVSSEMTLAEAGSKMMTENKKDYLVKSKNKKVTKDVMESELTAADPDFKLLRKVWVNAELNYRFWSNIHDICTDTLDRLQQIYNTLAAEARINGQR